MRWPGFASRVFRVQLQMPRFDRRRQGRAFVGRIDRRVAGDGFRLGLCLGANRRPVSREQLAVAHHHPPGNDNGLDLMPAGGVDQVGHDALY